MSFLTRLYSELGIKADAFPPGHSFTNNGLGTAGMFFAGAGDSQTRTSTVFMPTDSRRELYYQNRMEILKKSRWLFNNLGLLRRLVNGVARYSVGDGITPIPETTDLAWNALAQQYFDDWASNAILCDVQGKKTFWAMQKQAVKSMLKDGEFFAIQTAGADAPDPNDPNNPELIPGRPQLQWVESQVVANAQGESPDLNKDGFREGIKCNSLNRAQTYRVRRDKDVRLYDLADYSDVPAESMIHVFDSDRAGMVHGLPWAYSGVNSCLDMLDLNSLEKAAVKLHSTLAGSIKKKTADAGKRGFSGNLSRRKTVGKDGKQVVTAFENFMGGAAILQLATDEEFNLLSSDRPASTWIGFMDYLVRDIAFGFGVSPEFIWNIAGIGGANTRFILQDSQWFFEEIQTLLIDLFCQRVYVWVIARAMKRKELPACKDTRFWAARWQAPAQITVDMSKDSAAIIERLKNGLTTWEDVYASLGQNATKVLDKRIEELKRTMDKCKAAGVPFSLLVQLDPGSPAALALEGIEGTGETTATTSAPPTSAPAPTADEKAATDLENRMLNYSNAVKSGVITPNSDDEDYWRKELGLPPMSADVKAAWKADGTRFPITLQPMESTKPEPPKVVAAPPGAHPPPVPGAPAPKPNAPAPAQPAQK